MEAARHRRLVDVGRPPQVVGMADFPFAGRLEIDRRKLTDYLLSPAHPVGRSKARFFARLGFSPAEADRLDQALCDLASAPETVDVQDSRFGTKYIVDGQLTGPSSQAAVRTIWIVEHGSDVARFVTAYPESSQ
jgi:hypothetical protein